MGWLVKRKEPQYLAALFFEFLYFFDFFYSSDFFNLSPKKQRLNNEAGHLGVFL